VLKLLQPLHRRAAALRARRRVPGRTEVEELLRLAPAQSLS